MNGPSRNKSVAAMTTTNVNKPANQMNVGNILGRFHEDNDDEMRTMVKVGSGDLLNIPGKLDQRSIHQGSLDKYAMPVLDGMNRLLTQPDNSASKSALSSHFMKKQSRMFLPQKSLLDSRLTIQSPMPVTMKYQNNVSKRLNRKSSTHSIVQGGSQMIDGEHSVIVSQDLRKRLIEDPSLHGLRIGRSFGVAKRSLPPMGRKCQFIRDISPKLQSTFKRLNTDESLKF